jgi:hypothetical protein
MMSPAAPVLRVSVDVVRVRVSSFKPWSAAEACPKAQRPFSLRKVRIQFASGGSSSAQPENN